jgi:hypothetical protein
MAKHLGTEHTRVLCRPGDIARIFARMVWHTEAPVLRTAPAPLMLLSERVRAEGYKVVLTGEGADEVFAGYDLFKEAKIRRFWGRFPQSRIRPLLLRRLYPYLKHSPVAGGAFAERFFGSIWPGSIIPALRMPRGGPPHAGSGSSFPRNGERSLASAIRSRAPSPASGATSATGRRWAATSISKRIRC